MIEITICFFKLFHPNTVERPKKKRNEINNQSQKKNHENKCKKEQSHDQTYHSYI